MWALFIWWGLSLSLSLCSERIFLGREKGRVLIKSDDIWSFRVGVERSWLCMLLGCVDFFSLFEKWKKEREEKERKRGKNEQASSAASSVASVSCFCCCWLLFLR